MDQINDVKKAAAQAPEWIAAAAAYQTDALQRGILFADILRRRGNTYLDHIREGQPPVLVFKYEWVLDGRTLERPVNYAIVQIIDRRKPDVPDGAERLRNERRSALPKIPRRSFQRRPIVVVDPRAGHGPGIGGSKLDSEIGMALNHGHPVYFMMFFTDPEPGQTLADVKEAEVRFLEEVARRHPEAEKPALIGNCQAGWAVALIGPTGPTSPGPSSSTAPRSPTGAAWTGRTPCATRGGSWAASG